MSEQLRQSEALTLDRCPHCSVRNPFLKRVAYHYTQSHTGTPHYWGFYSCSYCGYITLARSEVHIVKLGQTQTTTPGSVESIYPEPETKLPEALPSKVADLLKQALESQHAPAGSMMLAASAVDAMLQSKGLKEGSLYQRIETAANSHLITEDMAKWAHHIRLEANDQRHSNVETLLPNTSDAKQCCDFAVALGVYLFELPARVRRGMKSATPSG